MRDDLPLFKNPATRELDNFVPVYFPVSLAFQIPVLYSPNGKYVVVVFLFFCFNKKLLIKKGCSCQVLPPPNGAFTEIPSLDFLLRALDGLKSLYL